MVKELLGRFALAGMAALFAVGCGGVSKEMYEARGTEIERLKMDLANEQAARKQCDDGRVADRAASEKQLSSLRERVERRAKQFRELVGKLQAMVEAGKLQVEVRNGLMVVKLPAHILFDPGKVELKAEGRDALKELGKALSDIQDRRFQIAGHTDNEPLLKGSRYEDNWSLSTARAVEVVNYLIKDAGMAASRLSAAGWADQMPVAPNDSEEGRRRNRRIEIVLLPNIDELPEIQTTGAHG